MQERASFVPVEHLQQPLMADRLPWTLVGKDQAQDEYYFQKRVYDPTGEKAYLADRVDLTPLQAPRPVQRALISYMNFRNISPRLMEEWIEEYGNKTDQPLSTPSDFFRTLAFQPGANIHQVKKTVKETYDDRMDGFMSSLIHSYFFTDQTTYRTKTLIQSLDYLSSLPEPIALSALEKYEDLYRDARRKLFGVAHGIVHELNKNGGRSKGATDNDIMILYRTGDVFHYPPERAYTIAQRDLIENTLQSVFSQINSLQDLLQMKENAGGIKTIGERFVHDIMDGIQLAEGIIYPRNPHDLKADIIENDKDRTMVVKKREERSNARNLFAVKGTNRIPFMETTGRCPLSEFPLFELNTADPTMPGYIPLPDKK